MRFSPSTAAILLLALALAFAAPAARAIPFNSAASASVWHNDNLSSSAHAADRRGDTALSLTLGGDQPRTLARDWLFSWGGTLAADFWENYDALDQTSLSGRMSLRRRFGLGAMAPTLTASLAGGPVWASTAALGGRQGNAALTFSHRPTELLRYTLGVAFDRLDAQNNFFSRGGHTFSGSVQAYLGESWSLTLGARERQGGVLSFAGPAWSASPPYNTIPEASTRVFGSPFDAYNVAVRARGVSAALVLALGPLSTLTLGLDHSETSWSSLRYRTNLLSLGLTQQF